MSTPLFYYPDAMEQGAALSLPEDTARHIVQVLRMNAADQIRLTDGNGSEASCTIVTAAKKRCDVQVESLRKHSSPAPALHLAIAFTKNASRNEWLLEKATELGVRTIIPIQADRSVRERFRYDRWHTILVSAMLQSQQYFLPFLHELATVHDILQRFNAIPQKLIAHCISEADRVDLPHALLKGEDVLLLIGPEGDFTDDEVGIAIAAGCKGISLGSRRLRTETAAIAASAYFSLLNND